MIEAIITVSKDIRQSDLKKITVNSDILIDLSTENSYNDRQRVIAYSDLTCGNQSQELLCHNGNWIQLFSHTRHRLGIFRTY